MRYDPISDASYFNSAYITNVDYGAHVANVGYTQ